MKRFLATFSATDVRNIIAIVFVMGCIVFVFTLIFKGVPPENKDLVNVIGGNVISFLGLVLGFYFGASKKDISSDTTTTITK